MKEGAKITKINRHKRCCICGTLTTNGLMYKDEYIKIWIEHPVCSDCCNTINNLIITYRFIEHRK